MNIKKLAYHNEGGGDRKECVEITFVHKEGMEDSLTISVDNLCCGLVQYQTDGKLWIKLPDDAQLIILRLARDEREKILAAYPVKTYEGWGESGVGSFGEYCKPGDEVDDAMVDYFLNVVPPATFKSNLIQAGEPYSSEPDENGKYRSTWTTFAVVDGVWRYCGECFAGQTQNRVAETRRIERVIKKLESSAA